MFDDIKKDGVNKVDDIFADSDKVEEATKTPQSSLADLNLKKPEINKENILDDFSDKDNKNSKKVLKTIILIFVILVIILIIAYIVYAKVLLPKTLQVNTNKDTNNEIVNVNTSSDTDVSVQEENINTDDINIIEEDIINNTSSDVIVDDNESGMEILKNIDSDSDGLNDYDETYVYKTDPNNLDSDGDVLSDYDEVNIFGTDPLLVSSDNDTYSDGQEIMSGYNPLGDGKINSSLFKNQNLFIEKYPELASK